MAVLQKAAASVPHAHLFLCKIRLLPRPLKSLAGSGAMRTITGMVRNHTMQQKLLTFILSMKTLKKFSKVVSLVFFLLGIIPQIHGQSNARALLEAMHARYNRKVCKTYSFSQRNTHYMADTVSGHSTWHEWVSFPDQFIIFFGDTVKRNFVHFTNDSLYSYRHDELVKTGADSNALLLLLGGMYYRQLDDVAARLNKSGYSGEKFSTRLWNGEKVFVYGAGQNDSLSNQFWVDAENLVIVRILEKMNATDYMDMRFESHKKMCGGYVETKVSFRRNGKLEQDEEYYDIRETNTLPRVKEFQNNKH
jgi:hypothetical protein